MLLFGRCDDDRHTFLRDELLCEKGKICPTVNNPTSPITSKWFWKNLSIAQAMKTPLQKRTKNCSCDRSKLVRIYGSWDRESIRDSFIAFLRELWFELSAEGKGGVIDLVREISGNTWDYAFQIVLDSFSRSIYEIIFCNWLCVSDSIMEANVKASFIVKDIIVGGGETSPELIPCRSAIISSTILFDSKQVISNNTEDEIVSFYTALVNARGCYFYFRNSSSTTNS